MDTGSGRELWRWPDYAGKPAVSGYALSASPLCGPEPDIRRAYAGKRHLRSELRPRSTRHNAQDDRLAARSRSTRSVTSRAIATAPSTSLSVSPLTIAKVISTYSLRPLLWRARVSVGCP